METIPIARMRITFGSWKKPLVSPPPLLVEPCRNATSASARTIAGTDSITLNAPVITESTLPPK